MSNNNASAASFRCLACLAVMFACVFMTLCASGQESDDLATFALEVRSVIESQRIPGGIAVTLGYDSAQPALLIADEGAFLVQALTLESGAVDSMRTEIREADRCETVSADLLLGEGKLPYAENMINLLVVHQDLFGDRGPISLEEIDRVMAPGGVVCHLFPIMQSRSDLDALIRIISLSGEQPLIAETLTAVDEFGPGDFLITVKLRPDEIDDWSHYRHGPDGNPVAQDTVVAPPVHLQWKDGPLNLRSHETDSSFSAAVVANGRFYSIVDEAALSTPGQEGLPDKWSLIARDAFNGVELWRIPISAWGWREWKDTWFTCRPGDMPFNLEMRIVAHSDGERLYVTLGYHAPVSEIDGRTGEILRTFEQTEATREILQLDDTLILSIADSHVRGAEARVAALDLKTGELLWQTEKLYGGTVTDYLKWKAMHGEVADQTVDPALNLATNGKVVVMIDETQIVALNLATGDEAWSADLSSLQEPTLWLGALIASDDVILYADRNRMFGLSADTGEIVWQQDKKYIGHLWYEWKEIFLIDGVVWTWSPEMVRGVGGLISSPDSLTGYDLNTGERIRDIPLGGVMKAVHHHRCYPNRATSRFILSSRRGTEFLDLEEGNHTVHNWVRGTCHFGMIPSHGLQYAPPHPCRCFFLSKLNGLNALAPAGPDADWGTALPEARLVRGPAFDAVAISDEQDSAWPIFLGNAQRYSASTDTVPQQLNDVWTTELGGRLSAPTVAAGLLFTSLVDQDQVVALDAATGEERWRRHVGGRVDSPPTYSRGSIVFGSADGWVYCLRAADGVLCWKYFAAKEDRRVNVFGRLESAWPIHGAVLVRDGLAYFASGRSSHLDGGITLFSLDMTSGEVVHEQEIAGPDYSIDNIEANDQRVLPEGVLSDILSTDGDAICMRGYRFNLDLTDMRPDAQPLSAKGGMLNGSYFRRMHWSIGVDGNYAQQVAIGGDKVYLARMFEKMIFLSPDGGYAPGVDGFQILAQDAELLSGALWSETFLVRIRSLMAADGAVIAAGPPDVMPQDDPHAAYEGRAGGRLLILDSDDGTLLHERVLPSSPVLSGTVLAEGKFFMTLENGSVVCLGD
jgi:outer membrane protein assembly factor BamB